MSNSSNFCTQKKFESKRVVIPMEGILLYIYVQILEAHTTGKYNNKEVGGRLLEERVVPEERMRGRGSIVLLKAKSPQVLTGSSKILLGTGQLLPQFHDLLGLLGHLLGLLGHLLGQRPYNGSQASVHAIGL